MAEPDKGSGGYNGNRHVPMRDEENNGDNDFDEYGVEDPQRQRPEEGEDQEGHIDGIYMQEGENDEQVPAGPSPAVLKA